MQTRVLAAFILANFLSTAAFSAGEPKTISTLSNHSFASVHANELESGLLRDLHGDISNNQLSALKEIEKGSEALLSQYGSISYEKASVFQGKGNGWVNYEDAGQDKQRLPIDQFLEELSASAKKLIAEVEQSPLDERHRAARKLGIYSAWLKIYQESGRLDPITINTADPFMESAGATILLSLATGILGGVGTAVGHYIDHSLLQEISAYILAQAGVLPVLWFNVLATPASETLTRYNWTQSGKEQVARFTTEIEKLKAQLCSELLSKKR